METKNILIGLVVALFTLAAFLGLGLIFYGSLNTVISDDYSATVTAFNASGVDNTTGVALTGSDRWGCAASITTAVNGTGHEAIASGNYTVVGCTLFTVGDPSYNNVDYEVNYTYTYGNQQLGTSINQSGAALANLPTWFSLIIIIFVLIVIFGGLGLAIFLLVGRSSNFGEGGSSGGTGTGGMIDL